MGIAIKMHQEKYNLKWHTFSDHLRNMLHEMMKSNELTDVTLVCDDERTFKAHKVVVSACSTVFKSIINKLPQNNSVIYLRGIHHQEMESILEFMYLGVATLYQERMNEFLNVAKNLEIKDIGKDVKFEKEVNEDSKSVQNTNSKKIINEKILQKNLKGKFDCEQCKSQFGQKIDLRRHMESIHEGVKYTYNQCDYKATYLISLRRHIQSLHEGEMFSCDNCDYQSSWQTHLHRHKKAKHS